MLIRHLLVVATVMGFPAAFSIEAGSKAKQSFRVNVPPRLSVTAPPSEARAELTPDQTQVQMTPQSWGIAANSQAGATVLFTTEQSFHHVSNDAIRRDAELKVVILNQSHASNWTVTQARAATGYQFGQETATVLARSHRPGSAVLGLTVTFLQGDSTSTPPGDYVTTVVGTMTAH